MARAATKIFNPDDPDEDAVATSDEPAISSGDDFTPTEELFRELKEKCTQARDHYESWYSEARQCYDYYAGRQWNDDDRQVLESQLRPVVTFNRTAPVIDSLIGMEMNDRKMVQYYPRTLGDAKINELYSSAAMWVREQADAEDEESDAFLDLAVCGMGWTDTHLVQDEDELGRLDIRIDRIDPQEMSGDPNSKKRNLADARFLVRTRSDIPLVEAEAMFPGFEPGELDAAWASDRQSQELVDLPTKYLFNDDTQDFNNRTRQTVTVVEIQWWEKRTFWKMVDPFTQKLAHFSDPDYKKLQERLKIVSPELKLQAVAYKRKIFRRAFLGSVILKIAPLPYPYGYSWNCMTGKRDKTKRQWFGLVRAMKDPQEWANKWLSQILHIINSNAKGGLMAPKTAFANWRDVEANWSRPDFIAWVNKAADLNSIKQREPVQFPAGLYQLMDFAITSIKDVNGFNLELLGMADRNQPSSLEYQRKQSGMTVLAQFFNSLRVYRKKQGRAMLYMIQKWLGDGRLIRITLDGGDQQYVPLLKNANEEVLEYDVVVDEVAASPNQKEQVWQMLQQAMPFLQQANLPGAVWSEIVRYSPLPASLATKIGEALNVPPDQAADAFAKTMQGLTVALAKSNVDVNNAQAASDQSSAYGKVAKAELDKANAAKVEAETVGAHLASVEQAIKNTLAQVPLPVAASPFAGAMQQ